MTCADGFCVAGLKTEYLDTPLGLETVDPRFSWQLASDRRNCTQRSYRILAATGEDNLDAGKADLWDSGQVECDRCFEIPYAGRALASGQRAYWRVCVWDEAGRQASAASWFEMGLLERGDWRAEWLVVEDPLETADRAVGIPWIWADTPHDGAPVQFRCRFELPAKPEKAALLLSAKDILHGVWVNGRELTVPKPVFWGTMCQLPIHLDHGVNVVCIEARALTEDFLPPDGGAIAAMLRIDATDGTVIRLTAGTHWRATKSAAMGWQETAFDDADWPAAVPARARTKCEPLPPYPARLLRRDFTVHGPIARARLYATALGAYEAFVNGEKVGESRLAPEVSTASHHVYYQTHDITVLLRQGPNAVGLHVADGWYAGAFAWRNERYALGDGPKRVVAQIVIEYCDGARQIVATDSSWRSHASAVLASDIYNGEYRDARCEQPGWCESGFNATQWDNAVVADRPPVHLISQISPPIRVTEELTATGINAVPSDALVYDFGQNFSGWCRLSMKGAAGTPATLRYSEILLPSGEVDQSNLRGAAATDVFVLGGDAEGEVFEPRFTYHGFRYVQCSHPAVVTGVAAHSDLPRTGTIEIANAQIRQFCKNTLWSQRANFFGVPTDCPQRDERMGWLGDIQVFLDAACFSMDTDAFIRRFLNEVRAEQSPEGAYPVVAPQPRSFSHMHTAGWSEAGIILPWTLFERYGDTRVIDDNWEAMNRWMRFLEEANPDWLWRNKRGLDLGDWLSVDAVKPWDETTPRMLAATAYWAYSAELMEKMARATGRSTAAQSFRLKHEAIVAAFRKEFVGPHGIVGNGSQTSYVLALKFGLVPETLRSAAATHLAAEIAKRGSKLSTGFLGTPYLLDVLCENGQVPVAIALLLETEYPSWGYMIRNGATTIWERWNADVGDIAMNSYNHYALGAVAGFIWRRLAGIAPAAPGFRHIQAKPIYHPRVGPVEAEYHSCLGRIVSRVEGDDGGLSRFALTIPANATAEVHLPAGSAWREGGRPLENCYGVLGTVRRGTDIIINIGSGDYLFEP